MRRLRAWGSRLRTLLDPTRRRRLERELDAELAAHVALHVDDNLRAGMTPAEARRVALARLGGIDGIREAARDVRGFAWLDALAQDLRYALRGCRRRPGFALITIVTLALGVGANTALFSVVEAVLLRPLPFVDAGSLVALWERDIRSGRLSRVTAANYRDWRASAATLADIALFGNSGHTLVGDGEPERVPGVRVSANYFTVLGIEPLLGRTFRAAETEPGADRVVLLGYGLWQRRFGGDPDVVDRVLQLDGPGGGTRTVIGVLPPGAYPTAVPVVPALPLDRSSSGVWVPLALDPAFRDNRRTHVFGAIGRLRPGVGVTEAQADLDRIADGLARAYPTNAGEGVAVVPLHEQVVGAARPALLLLAGVVGVVLLIACGNLASLGIARATARRREVAVRAALGASPARLARQFLTETVLLALAGGALGAGVAQIGVRVLTAIGPADVPRLDEAGLDGTVLVFTAVLSLATGIAVGLAPARQAARPGDGALAGRAVTAGPRVRRLRNGLVVGEIATAAVVLVGAGLLLASYARIIRTDPGFEVGEALVVPLALSSAAYPAAAQVTAFYDALLARLGAAPGVVAVAAGYDHPLSVRWIDGYTVVGRPPPEPGDEPSAPLRAVTPDYFRAAGVTLRAGRAFDDRDRADGPGVVVVNRTFAETVFPGEAALGQRLAIPTPGRFWGDLVPQEYAVVGLVDDVRFGGLDQAPQPAIYIPFGQFPQHGMTLVVRVRAGMDALALTPAVRGVVWDLDRDQPLGAATTLATLASASLDARRFHLWLIGLFGALAVALAAIGLYGVLAYLVAERRAEFGVRLALGAARGDVFALVVGHGARLMAVGLALGLAGALGLARLIASLLYETSPADPSTLAGVALLVGAVGLAACLLPARRATRVDPATALRAE